MNPEFCKKIALNIDLLRGLCNQTNYQKLLFMVLRSQWNFNCYSITVLATVWSTFIVINWRTYLHNSTHYPGSWENVSTEAGIEHNLTRLEVQDLIQLSKTAVFIFIWIFTLDCWFWKKNVFAKKKTNCFMSCLTIDNKSIFYY